jgi:low affinity Fe/Cu permease
MGCTAVVAFVVVVVVVVVVVAMVSVMQSHRIPTIRALDAKLPEFLMAAPQNHNRLRRIAGPEQCESR